MLNSMKARITAVAVAGTLGLGGIAATAPAWANADPKQPVDIKRLDLGRRDPRSKTKDGTSSSAATLNKDASLDPKATKVGSINDASATGDASTAKVADKAARSKDGSRRNALSHDPTQGHKDPNSSADLSRR